MISTKTENRERDFSYHHLLNIYDLARCFSVALTRNDFVEVGECASLPLKK